MGVEKGMTFQSNEQTHKAETVKVSMVKMS